MAGTDGYATFSFYFYAADPDIYQTAYKLDSNFNFAGLFGTPSTAPYLGEGNTGMSVDGAGNVYGINTVGGVKRVYRVDHVTGAMTAVAALTYAGSTSGRISIGVSYDGTLLYWSYWVSSIDSNLGRIRKHSLVTDTDLGIFASMTGTGAYPCLENGILVLSNGDVIVAYRDATNGIRRYNAAGVLQRQYTVPGYSGGITIVADVNSSVSPAPDIDTSFIVHHYSGLGVYGVAIARLKTDDGTLLDLFIDPVASRRRRTATLTNLSGMARLVSLASRLSLPLSQRRSQSSTPMKRRLASHGLNSSTPMAHCTSGQTLRSQIPPIYFGGYKEHRVIEFQSIRRGLSNIDGAYEGIVWGWTLSG